MADHPSPSISDYKCSICLELLVEPVQLPCKHELCRPCFRHNVEEANFACPICRKRIASWARKCNREGTLVNQKKWTHIQKLFPDRCLKRLNGEADDSEDECLAPPKRILAQSGELRQEYEKEMNKIIEERETEQRASEALIKTLLDKEKAIELQRENQRRDDELFAKRVADEMENESQRNHDSNSPNTSSSSGISTPLSQKENKLNSAKKKQKSNGKSPPSSHKIDKYFSKFRVKDCPISHNVSGKKENDTDKDLQLAKALQKKFDEEAMAFEKRE